jgi:hypothetical protein
MVFHFHQMANIWQQLAGMVCLFHCHFFFILVGALPECQMPISFGNLILLSWNVLRQKTGTLAQLVIDPDNVEGVYTIVLGGNYIQKEKLFGYLQNCCITGLDDECDCTIFMISANLVCKVGSHGVSHINRWPSHSI